MAWTSKKKRNKTKKVLLIVSVAFVGLMLSISALLYLNTNQPLQTEQENLQTNPGIVLKDIDLG
jgi:hypothetical protein